MLKKLFKRLRGSSSKRNKLSARLIPESEHGINPRDISSGSIRVIDQLQKAGYQAFLVGGGVRDLMLGLHPKDFDVATSATPEQIKQVIRSARIIGRRFRLVHVPSGRETVEVATFRAHHNVDDDQDQHAAQTDASGIITRDNLWGSIEQDAERRDFTVNALYYDPTTRLVHDFCSGAEDLKAHRLRLIGIPEHRYREDPVRILRAIRFSAKLDFCLDDATTVPLRTVAPMLAQISPHRLSDEVHKLLGCGHAQRVMQLLQEYDLLGLLFPHVHFNDAAWSLIMATAQNTDQRIAQGKSINPAFFLAALLWRSVVDRQHQLQDHGVALIPSWQQAGQHVLQQQMHRTALTKYVVQTIREIWDLQPRLQHPDPRHIATLSVQPRFRAGFDFLVLREACEEDTGGMGAWWDRYQEADPGLQAEMIRDVVVPKPAAKNRRRPRKRKSPQSVSATRHD